MPKRSTEKVIIKIPRYYCPALKLMLENKSRELEGLIEKYGASAAPKGLRAWADSAVAFREIAKQVPRHPRKAKAAK